MFFFLGGGGGGGVNFVPPLSHIYTAVPNITAKFLLHSSGELAQP